MQTRDRTGIICDYCKSVYRQDFVYYSINVHKVQTHNGRKPALETIRSTVAIKSFDMCNAKCFDDLKTTVLKIYSANMRNKTGGPQNIFCEISGESLNYAPEYYYASFSRVDVIMSNQPLVCVKCGKSTKSDKIVCGCGSDSFRRQAVVNVSDRELEIYISNVVYNTWLENMPTDNIQVWSSSS